MLPKIHNYSSYSSNNYGAHSLCVSFDRFSIYFSYETPIAFVYRGRLRIRENDWSTTTGKHLNSIDNNKKIRIDGGKFERMFNKLIAKLGI